MTRRQVGAIATIVIATTIIGLFSLAFMPVWLPVLLIRPSLIQGPSDYVMRKVAGEMSKMMFRNMKVGPPTGAYIPPGDF